MEDSMRQRLIVAEKRLAEIDEELMNPEIMKDLPHFREISKERATLEPQVEAFKQYLKNEEEILGAQEMARDDDPDISEMGKEEIKRLEAEQEMARILKLELQLVL